MNVKLLEQVKQSILAKPQRFVMSNFIEVRKNCDYFLADDGTHVNYDHCGTAACIAGWTCLMKGKVQAGKIPEHNFDFANTAADLLDIDDYAQEGLFYVDNWPERFHDAYRSATSQEERAQVAAQRIDHFIATGGTE